MDRFDLRTARHQLSLSHEQVAERASLPVHAVASFERGERIRRAHRKQIDWALWSFERDQILAQSGLAPCNVVKELADSARDGQGMKRLVSHVETCDLCTARSRHLQGRIRKQPTGGGLLAQVLAYLGALQGWQQAACAGALMLVGMGGVGVPVLLLLSLLRLDVRYALGALALLVVLALSGGVGGVVYYGVRPLRAYGLTGHVASGVLTVCGYGLAVVLLFAAGAAITGEDPWGPESGGMVLSPAFWIIFACFGIVFGWQARKSLAA